MPFQNNLQSNVTRFFLLNPLLDKNTEYRYIVFLNHRSLISNLYTIAT